MQSINNELLTSIVMVLLAVWGGLSNFLSNKKASDKSIIELINQLLTSGFTGLVIYFLCKYKNLDVYLTAALVGISGHMGARLLTRLEKFVANRTKNSWE